MTRIADLIGIAVVIGLTAVVFAAATLATVYLTSWVCDRCGHE
jgi:hypothetical protein